MPTLIVETGAIVSGANSYVTLDEANAYHARVGNGDWTAPGEEASPTEIAEIEATLNAALIMATESLTLLYGTRMVASLLDETRQELVYPRTSFYDRVGRRVVSGTVPKCLREAQCEIALMRLQGIDIFPKRNSGAIQSEKTSVGSVSEERTYYTPVGNDEFPNFDRITLMLSPILHNKNANWSLRA